MPKNTPAASEPSTAEPSAPPVVRADLAKTIEADALAAARVNLARLRADLADAKIASDAATAQYDAAQRAWDRAQEAGVSHTSAEGERLTRLWQESSAAKARITDLESQIAECEYVLGQDVEAAARTHRQQLAATVWPPMVARMMRQARDFLAALKAQDAVRAQLSDAGAWGMVAIEDLSMLDRDYISLCPRIAAWLAACEKAGFTAEPPDANTGGRA